MAVLKHYGTPRHSGRFPWGSGKDPEQRAVSFLGNVDKLKAQGLSPVEIAKGMGMNTSELRRRITISDMVIKQAKQGTAVRLKEKGYSNVAIGTRMGGLNESSVRDLLNPSKQEKNKILLETVSTLKAALAKDRYLDVSSGIELHLPKVSRTKLQTAILMLQDEGYNVHYVKVPQLGTKHETSMMVLAVPGDRKAQYHEMASDFNTIKTLASRVNIAKGDIQKPKVPPRNVDIDRVMVRYADDGGKLKDGTIELRPGAEDLQLGDSRYAQVRIAVNGTHYLKGMAFYGNPKDFPPGVDVIFNTNKNADTPILGDKKHSILKPMKMEDPLNPFGATFVQNDYTDKTGKKQLSALNIVRREGEWSDWSNTLSSQVLSKQVPELAKKQLALSFDIKREEFREISSLTNPTVKKLLLQAFADECDSAAVDLDAASMPRQSWNVILPFNSIKETEVYAPNYNDGDRVVLIRYPHAGRFEIPELTVNNSNREARSAIGMAKDAIGIHSKVAEQLSGADFDGDTVLVIPNNNKAIKIKPQLEKLKTFEPRVQYQEFPGMHIMTSRETGLEMGMISNLITDMTIKGATPDGDEICRAVKHSMVVIDAEKHKLNYRQSYIDNGIAELKKKYQGRSDAGAATLISKASSQYSVLARKELVNKKKMTPEELAAFNAGQKIYRNTGDSYIKYYNKKKNPLTGEVEKIPLKTPKLIERKEQITKMLATSDARTLSSGYYIEEVYAEHANQLKALANSARKMERETPNLLYNPSAKKVYSKEVDGLMANLRLAMMNPPLEREAQRIANMRIKATTQDNPSMSAGDLKKLKGRALQDARDRIGAKKVAVPIDDKSWEAIQAGAITHNVLMKILRNADQKAVKQLAMPRASKGMSAGKIALAKSYLANGYTTAQVANMLEVSTSTLNASLKP